MIIIFYRKIKIYLRRNQFFFLYLRYVSYYVLRDEKIIKLLEVTNRKNILRNL